MTVIFAMHSLRNGYSISFYLKVLFFQERIREAFHRSVYHVDPYMKGSDIGFREYIIALRSCFNTLER